jgi:hypothetical protein
LSGTSIVAQIVAHRMQRDRQHDADLLAGALDLGTTPEVDSVMRRFESDALRRRRQSAAPRARIEIVERLAHAHHDDVGHEAVPSGTMARRRRPGKIAEPVARDQSWPTISSAVRLRTSRCVPVWQNEQVSVQPTWLETQSVPRSIFGNIDGLDLDRPSGAARGKAQ